MDFLKDYRIVLASGSPRRKEILEQLDLEFEVWPSDEDESVITEKDPSKLCEALSSLKAESVTAAIKTYNLAHPDITSPQDIMVIGSDTIVVCDGDVLGKPADEEDAVRMLLQLQGRTHEVYTGVTLFFMDKGGRCGKYSFHDVTKVSFYPMSEAEIKEYVSTGEPKDKAGAYGIQGKAAKYIKGINGDFYNVMGFPASKFYLEIKGLLGDKA